MAKINYLNVGCGNKFHKDWENIDMVATSEYVRAHNILSGLPYQDCSFDVIYHSQVLEHFRKEDAPFFINECYRVLKPGGIMRVVVPDLENIVREYLYQLENCLKEDTFKNKEKYDWMVLELLDQTVRNSPGGEMLKFLQQPELLSEDFIIKRAGHIVEKIRDEVKREIDIKKSKDVQIKPSIEVEISFFRFIKRAIKGKFVKSNPEKTLSQSIGEFRMGGEIHQWLYDRYSLFHLLTDTGFVSFEILSPEKSNILEWDKYELDIKNEVVFDPNSLFVEVRR